MAASGFVMTIDSDNEDGPSSSKLDKHTSQDGADLNPDFNFDLSGDVYSDLLADRVHPADVVKTGSKPDPISVDDIIARRKLNGKRKREPDDNEDGLGEEDSEINDHTSDDEEPVGDMNADSGSEDEQGSDNFPAHEVDDDDDADPLATSDEDEPDGDAASGSAGSELGLNEDSSDADSDFETEADKARKAAFFAPPSDGPDPSTPASFLTMNLSRPILKALASLSFHVPTPIQAATIPVALLGKDVVGNAVTGSGKTAAFLVPMLERLLYRERGKRAAATRCLVLVPTRELAVQCLDVGTKLAAHTDVRFCLAVGGLSVKSQEAALRTRPDIVIATPGRLIDHLRNAPSFALDALDVLVLDEADRMLSDGFADELAEIVQACPPSRQTLLFSATMTDSVDDLVRMSLRRPVRLFVDPRRTTARGLVQEFVRVRAGKEKERSPLLVALCKRTFKNRALVFFRSKKLAHQMRVVFGLLDMKCGELHGDLTQEQRLSALQSFKDGKVDYLMATDLASRGLDIKGVEAVINYDMPNQLAQYLHRVGRTARAGEKGRSVTLVGEADRKMLKAAIKHGAGEDQVRHRIVPPEAVARWAEKLEVLKTDVAAILQEEKEEKQLRQAEMELKKSENMMEHEEEIHSRPARTWFQSGKEKMKAEAISKQQYESASGDAKRTVRKDAADAKPKRDKLSGLTRRAKRRKLALEADREEHDSGKIAASVRAAKKAGRPAKIGEPIRHGPSEKKLARNRKKEKNRGKGAVRDGFDKELGRKATGAPTEGVRAKKGDAIGGMGKKKVKRSKVK